jgi:hypothetical protein
MNLANPPGEFLKSKAGVATLIGVGAAVVIGVVAYTSKSSAKTTPGGTTPGTTPETLPAACWLPIQLTQLFEQPGHYRIELVGSTPASGDVFYPSSNTQLEQTVAKLRQTYPDVSFDGMWFPAYTDQGVTVGPFSYGAIPMPAEWPLPTDGKPRMRIQFTSPYVADPTWVAALLSKVQWSPDLTLTLQRCTAAPPPSKPLPIKWTRLAPDQSGNTIVNAGTLARLSVPAAAAPQTVDSVKTMLQTLGYTVLHWYVGGNPMDWPADDLGPNRWRFDVYAQNQPMPIAGAADAHVYTSSSLLG